MENWIELVGYIDRPFAKEYTRHGMDFYKSKIRIRRTSGCEDVIPVITCHKTETGYVKVLGSFRSYNQRDDGALNLYVFADSISKTEQEEYDHATIIGNICKINQIRRTPRGKWICDFILAVNNATTSYYLPCIAWGSIAYDISNFYMVGDLVEINGRVQSRHYTKEYDCQLFDKTAYEISINSITRI